jgi:hypothetical protein
LIESGDGHPVTGYGPYAGWPNIQIPQLMWDQAAGPGIPGKTQPN